MHRRSFIRRMPPMLALPFLLDGFRLSAARRSNALARYADALAATDRVLILIQLSGGNDGINTVIPIDQYSSYASVRANIAIPEARLLAVATATGLHPSMTGVQSLFRDGKAAVVQGVTYPNPNLSHFRSTDIWLTAANYNEYLRDGWLGRYLDGEFPGYPTGYPNASMPDPLAIQIGAVVSESLQGPQQLLGIAIQDPDTFYALVNGGKGGGIDDPPSTPAGKELTFIRTVQTESMQYSTVIKDAAAKAQNKAAWPAARTNALADQLRIVSRLIAGGLQTRIYVVSLGGFDTHSSQVQVSPSPDPLAGAHATLLGRLSEAVSAFQEDLRLLGIEDRVLSMTFSEFGRRVKSNSSYGTDHGTAAPVFVFGSQVRAGVIGVNPSLTDLDNGNLKMQYDFRQVYASVLGQWFGLQDGDVRSILLRDFTQFPLIRTHPTGVEATTGPSGFTLDQNYPNPFNPVTTIGYTLPAETRVRLDVFDARGALVATLSDGTYGAGGHRTVFNAAGLPSGTYHYRLSAGGAVMSRTMTVLK